jgi:glyoxylase I family protein
VEKVLGIGGLFFRARDPVALARWYAEQLGIALTPASYDEQPWHQAAGADGLQPLSGHDRLLRRARSGLDGQLSGA